MYKIGVVARCYNKSKTIDLSLSSLVDSYDFENIFVVIVDDGSTDDSRKKIMDYVQLYDNMKLLAHDKNYGSMRALVSGIKYIHQCGNCEYITFLDIDDYVTDGWYELLYDTIVDNNADIVIGSNYELTGNDKRPTKSNRYTWGKFNKNGNFTIGDFHWVLWNKLFKVSLFNKFCAVIDEHMLYCSHDVGLDDFMICLYLYEHINKICSAPNVEHIIYNASDAVEHIWATTTEEQQENLKMNTKIYCICNGFDCVDKIDTIF